MPKFRSLGVTPRANFYGGIGLKLDLRPLLAGDKLLTFEYELPIDTAEEANAGFLYGVSFPSPMKVRGDITNTAGYMLMQLCATVDYESFCARCLKPTSGSFTLDLEKTVAPRNVLAELPEEKYDDYAIIDDGFLEIDELLLDSLGMEFPSRFLCKDDCLGLCQRCGHDLNLGKCSCPEKEIDPRLAPLQKILEKMKQEENNK